MPPGIGAAGGALSACGGQYSDMVGELTQSRFAYTGDFPYEDGQPRAGRNNGPPLGGLRG